MEKIIIWKDKETALTRFVMQLTFFSFLIFCIWLSKGSTFWTFLLGSSFIFIIAARAIAYTKNVQRIFTSKQQVQAWLDTQP